MAVVRHGVNSTHPPLLMNEVKVTLQCFTELSILKLSATSKNQPIRFTHVHQVYGDTETVLTDPIASLLNALVKTNPNLCLVLNLRACASCCLCL